MSRLLFCPGLRDLRCADDVGVATCRPAAVTVIFFNSQDLPVADRADAVRETVANTFVHVEIDFAAGGPPAALGSITDVGPVRICSLRTNALTANRTPKLARDDLPPSIFVGACRWQVPVWSPRRVGKRL